jgi:hypothetical protein
MANRNLVDAERGLAAALENLHFAGNAAFRQPGDIACGELALA